jgi:uncharacterized RDD family membrane protein YckC
MTILDQPPTTSQPIEYASFGERLVARLIDAMILLIPSMFVPFILPWLYFAIQEGSERGATVGKRAMNIRVVSEDGKSIGFGTATGRFFGNLLNLFTLCIGYLLMLFNARNQCLHDMITSTVVIKNRPGSGQQQRSNNPTQKLSWSNKLSETETHFIEINAQGGRHWHRTSMGERINDFTLWQLTDGLVDFSAEFGPEANHQMKQFAEHILRSKV